MRELTVADTFALGRSPDGKPKLRIPQTEEATPVARMMPGEELMVQRMSLVQGERGRDGLAIAAEMNTQNKRVGMEVW